MRTLALLSVPVMIVLGLTNHVRAQGPNSWGVGVGVGWGWGGPGYGWGPAWGFYPTHYHGFYGNGLSMYGPPVPTGRPIPGVFGGGDSAFFDLPPIYPGWLHAGYGPVSRPCALPPTLFGPPSPVLPPAPVLDRPAALVVEVRLPRADARLFIDGQECQGTGTVRHFKTPAVTSMQPLSYELRAEWNVEGYGTTHAMRLTGRAGDTVVADFTRGPAGR
jgi:uncharacterized protein (TIGR03000 family)